MAADDFHDLLAANQEYQATFSLRGLTAPAAKRVAVLTCMDSRIEPLGMLGLVPGDAKIMRNAGARVTKDALRSLVLAANLLDVERIAVVQHTDCAMVKNTDDELRAAVTAASGADATDMEFLAIADQKATLRGDVAKVRDCPQIPDTVIVEGFVYDVDTGAVIPVT